MKRLVMVCSFMLAGCEGAPAPRTASDAPPAVALTGCQPHVELHDAAHWAKELGQTEEMVMANHRINVWQNPSPDKGAKVGELYPGSRAVILEERPDDYRVQSPADKSIGWVSKIQVARTLKQDVASRQPCS